jgi:hypothetical protein
LKRPKAVALAPPSHNNASSEGFLCFQLSGGSAYQGLYLGLAVFAMFFFLLFRVWPEWLRVGVWYVSFYFLVFLIGAAIVRVIVFAIVWHVGIAFWIFPNYWIDGDSIFDSFWPIASLELSEDAFSVKMWAIRLVSMVAIANGVAEFLREPEALDDFMSGASDAWNEGFMWGQNKFLGIPDNTTQLQTTKSAKEIFAEAFMEDEQMKGVGGYTAGKSKMYTEEDDEGVDPSRRHIRRPREDSDEEEEEIVVVDPEDDPDAIKIDSGKGDSDLLDSLLGGDDDDDDEEEEISNDTAST